MKFKSVSLLAAALLLGGIPAAFAADIGTDAGTDVNNEATVSYTVNAIPQTATTGNTTFKVDRKVDLTVASSSSVSVTPGQTDQLLFFTVTNKTNDTLDFDLALVTDGDFTATGLAIYRDANDNDVLDAGEMTPITSLDDVLEDVTVKLIVSGDIPVSATDGQSGNVHLRADALDSAGNALTDDSGTANTVAVENVFADLQGTATATDAANDAKHSAVGTYNVGSATIAVTKQVDVVCETNDGNYVVDGDGVATGGACGANISGAGNLKAIPGATLQYCIRVENNGTQDATGISVSDPLGTGPGNNVTDYVYWIAESIKVGVDCNYNAGTSVAVDDDTVDDAGDETGIFGSYNATTKTVNAATNATLGNGDVATVMFRVLVK